MKATSKVPTNNMISSDSIMTSIDNGGVILTGRVKTYRERRLIGQEVWNTCGVVKVLNDIQIIEPETAGPSEISGGSE
jgi:osmotically-inducible protein OsmY